MKSCLNSLSRSTRQKGLSLVELMVSIVIGLIVLAGVVQVMVSSKTTFLGQEEMSYIQENARYAMDVIGRDIQSAGHWGCTGSSPAIAMVASIPTGAPNAAHAGSLLANPNNPLQPIFGYEGADADLPPLYKDAIRPIATLDGGDIQDTPDSFIVRRLAGVEHPVIADDGSQLTLAENASYREGQFLAVIAEDCRRLGVFRAAAVDAATVTYAGGICPGASLRPTPTKGQVCDSACTNGCPGTFSSQRYPAGSTVTGYVAHAYFIGESNIAGVQPALMRASLSGGGVVIEEIALGVEDMEVLYGVDVDGNSHPEQYLRADQVTATDGWNRVISVQVNLLFRSQGPGPTPPADDPIEHLQNDYSDRFVRQEVSSTFRLRNRF